MFTRVPSWWQTRYRKTAMPASFGFSPDSVVDAKLLRNMRTPGACSSAKSERRCPVRSSVPGARLGRDSSEPRARLDPATIDQEAAGDAATRSVIPFVGRLAERARIDRLLSTAANGRTTPILLVGGEPGIGKSRLLEHLADCMVAIGGLCLKGRAFEAEAGHPYGAWIEALSAVPGDSVPKDTRQNLALLRPALGLPPSAPADRGRLFEAVLSLLRHLARRAPLAIVLDDLQWLDEASSALLHYVGKGAERPGGSAVRLRHPARRACRQPPNVTGADGVGA